MKIVLFANTDWYLYNFNRSLARALCDAGQEVLLLSPPGPYGEKLKEMGFHWIPIPMQRRSLNPLRELRLVFWLRRLFVRETVDLVHGFTIKCAVYGSLAARLAGVPARVNSVSGMGYVFTSDDMKARLLRPVVRALMRFALDDSNARLVLLNKDDEALFRQSRLVDGGRIRLIPGAGVDCRRFVPAPTKENNGTFRVLLAARLLWDKGVAEYVEAARQLAAQGREIEFLLAGAPDSGNPAAVPIATLNSWVDDGVVRWLGHTDDMPRLLHSVDVMVLPSYREGLPTGLTEAASCALPMVATDVPGCREVITDGVDGFLVPVKDAQALAQAIARLHDDPALRTRLGNAARVRALAEFDERIVVERTMAIYNELSPPTVSGRRASLQGSYTLGASQLCQPGDCTARTIVNTQGTGNTARERSVS